KGLYHREQMEPTQGADTREFEGISRRPSSPSRHGHGRIARQACLSTLTQNFSRRCRDVARRESDCQGRKPPAAGQSPRPTWRPRKNADGKDQENTRRTAGGPPGFKSNGKAGGRSAHSIE